MEGKYNYWIDWFDAQNIADVMNKNIQEGIFQSFSAEALIICERIKF